ncbi:hypothetical protein PCANC_19235 [Puccinia coronata f. sp. avenae]|uniref:Uncharacterized protein n=1 Tax=Puccinia coronata f. sp. avenae TaxID=200324 RepID=A0A2N5U9W6_9BASI|nr:hypothetical protein PCANC_19235 [Puccinia coronata f. sp. avenae]
MALSTSPFTAEHCRNALRKFTTESGVIFWSGDRSHSCGSCKVTITKPSLPNSNHHAAVLAEVLTAVNLGYDKCQGRPTNATIGNYQPVSVLLDDGDGENEVCHY